MDGWRGKRGNGRGGVRERKKERERKIAAAAYPCSVLPSEPCKQPLKRKLRSPPHTQTHTDTHAPHIPQYHHNLSVRHLYELCVSVCGTVCKEKHIVVYVRERRGMSVFFFYCPKVSSALTAL